MLRAIFLLTVAMAILVDRPFAVSPMPAPSVDYVVPVGPYRKDPAVPRVTTVTVDPWEDSPAGRAGRARELYGESYNRD